LSLESIFEGVIVP